MKTKALLLVTIISSIGNFMRADEARLFREYAMEGNIAELAKLYQSNSEFIHQVSAFGQSALHFAAMFGQEDAVRFLVAQGAKPFLRDQKGQTPFDFAFSNGFFEIANLLEGKGIEIIFNFKNLCKFSPETITPEAITQWIREDIANNARLRRAVNKARSLGLKQLIFTDSIDSSASCTSTEIFIDPFHEQCPGFGAAEFRERIRMGFCFELANMLNEDMNVTTEIHSFMTPQAYADAVITAEAKSFMLAEELFTFSWIPNAETSRFFARSEALKDLKTYRDSLHYKKYVQQYLFHTIPGLKEKVVWAVTKATDSIKLFTKLEALFRQGSLSAEERKLFAENAAKYKSSFKEYLLFLSKNRIFLEGTVGEIEILNLFDTLHSNDEKLTRYLFALGLFL